MPINVNCQCFRYSDSCMHHAAPRRWFGYAKCILISSGDPRVKTCALQAPFSKPDGYPMPPPSRMVSESGCEWLDPTPSNSTAGCTWTPARPLPPSVRPVSGKPSDWIES